MIKTKKRELVDLLKLFLIRSERAWDEHSGWASKAHDANSAWFESEALTYATVAEEIGNRLNPPLYIHLEKDKTYTIREKNKTYTLREYISKHA